MADSSDLERTIQDTFQERVSNYGLRRLRQVQVMG